MEYFTAKNTHSETSVRKLSEVQYNLFGLAKQLGIFLSGAVMVGVGLFVSVGEISFFLLLFIGGWLIASVKLPQRRQADKLIEAMNGRYPQASFSFQEKSVLVTVPEDCQRVPYSKIVCLAEDAEAYYIFIHYLSAYMVPKDSLRPKNDAGFREFLSEKTGLLFQRPCSLLGLSLKEIRVRIANVRTLRARRAQKK